MKPKETFDEEKFKQSTKRLFDGILKLADDVRDHSETLPEDEKKEFIKKFLER